MSYKPKPLREILNEGAPDPGPPPKKPHNCLKPPLRAPAGACVTCRTDCEEVFETETWRDVPLKNLFHTDLLKVAEHLSRENAELKKRKCPFCDSIKSGDPIPCGSFKGEIGGTVQESHLEGGVMVIDKIRIEHVSLDLGGKRGE